MKMTAFFASVAVLFAAGACFAAETTTIGAELDKSSVSTDETVTYKLTVLSSEQRIPAPRLPDFKGFTVLSSSQSSSLSFQGDRMRTMLVYAFVLLPETPGKAHLGPASLAMQGRTLTTKEFDLQVTQGKTTPRTPAPGRPQRKLPRDLGGEPQYEI